MKIVFDCTYLRNRQTGVDVTFISLLQSLLKIDKTNKYIIFTDHRFDSSSLEKSLEEHVNFKFIKIFCYYPLHIFISAFVMPLYLLLNRIKVYHNPYFFGPLFKLSKTRVIITVHDLYHKTIPEKMNGLHNLLLKLFSDSAIKKADKIIVISSQTKADAMKYYGFPDSKLSLIYQAIDESVEEYVFEFNNFAEEKQIEPFKYILCVGKILPSKGIDDLIRGYRVLQEKGDFRQFKLVLAGISDTEYYTEIKNLIISLKLNSSNIIFLGYVTQNELRGLYQNAQLYVLPSYYEGFGLTALEAMKYNCPVISRNASSLPEVVGDAGFLFNNVDELGEHMFVLTTNEAARASLIENGKKQIAKFSGEVRARKTLELYLN